MEKMISKANRSGKKSATIIGISLLLSFSGFSTASSVEPGPFQIFMIVTASLLLGSAVFETVRWVFRSEVDSSDQQPVSKGAAALRSAAVASKK